MRNEQLPRPRILLIGLMALFLLLSSACGRAGGEAGVEASVPVAIAPTAATVATPSTAGTSIEAAAVTVQAKGFAQDIQSAAYGFVVVNPNESLAWENVAYQVTLKTADGRRPRRRHHRHAPARPDPRRGRHHLPGQRDAADRHRRGAVRRASRGPGAG